MRILVMGLPGSGKTTISTKLARQTGFTHLNADEVRKQYDDWDFSPSGRRRQAERMANLSENGNFILDFVCPRPRFIDLVKPDYVIWMDTITESRFEDTNAMFMEPRKYNIRIENFQYDFTYVLWKLESDLLLKQ